MFTNSGVFRVAASAVLVLSSVFVTFGDTVRLKDGSIIKGKIVAFGGGKFTVAVGDGSRRKEMTFLAAEVETIQFDANQPVPPAGGTGNRNASYEEPSRITPTPAAEGNPAQPAAGGIVKPIEINIKVLADNTSNGWTNTGWVVKKGQKIRISGDGKVQLGRGQSSMPDGISSLEDSQKLLKNVPTGALLAVIGDDNNDFIYIGSSREFTAQRDGALFLGINEGNLDDNSGAYNVKIEITPDSTE